MERQNNTADVAHFREWIGDASRACYPDTPASYAAATPYLGEGWSADRVEAGSRVILAELAA